MADLYGSSESEDISSILQSLLHNNSSVAATNSTSADGLIGGAGTSTPLASAINFSDPTSFFGEESEGISSSAKLGNFVSSSEEAEIRVKSAPTRSSKRSRAAEIHNLSEKRRRSRINEKLKALQNLVPNSSKTDKASMLDEAIEYLKQLQLQVQMLTMRNGLSLHPGYPLGSMLEPQCDEGRIRHTSSRRADALSLEQEIFGQTDFETSNHASSVQTVGMPSSIINSSLQIPAGFTSPAQNNYGLVNRVASSKDIFRGATPSRFQFSGTNSSPGVSS